MARLVFLIILTCCTGLPAQDVTVDTLDGEKYAGTLQSLDRQGITIQIKDNNQTIPANRLLKLTWPHEAATEPPAPESTTQLLLSDGSLLLGSKVSSDGVQVQFDSAAFGSVSIPQRNVKAILLRSLDDNLKKRWKEFLDSTSNDDRLVIQKGEVLDFLPGVITQHDASAVSFLYDGNEIPVKTEKVTGIIHPTAFRPDPDTLCSVKTTTNEIIYARQVQSQDGQLNLVTNSGQTLGISPALLNEIDFSLGKVVYLSDLDPEGTEYTPFFDTIWEMQRDRTLDGQPLQIGQTTYRKGLWVHSRSRLTYRLAGEFSRFQAVLGIDYVVASLGHGNVDLTITGDGQELFSGTVTARDKALPIDLDVSNKQFLQISVDFGKGLDIGDHLDLADAKLIK